MINKSNIVIHRCGLKSAPMNVAVMLLLTLILYGCSNELNSETVVGTWDVVEIIKPNATSDADVLWGNKNNHLIFNIFKQSDQWVLSSNQTLEHKSKIGIWPRPRSYRLEGDQLYFYLGDLKDTPDMKPMAQFTIIKSKENEFSITQSNSESDVKTVAILKKVKE